MMRFSPILLFHICSGTVSVLAGFAAISLRKGSHRHRVVGNVFFISMLGLGLSGAYMGLLKSQVTNVLGGVFDWIALLVALAVGATEVTFGLQAARSPTGLRYGYPVWPFAMFALVALLAAVGDVRMLVHRGVSGTPRLVRHLWRMCFAFFIASASIFLARPHLFPALLRKNVIPFLGVLPLILMLFWLVRVRFAHVYRKKSMPRAGAVSSARI
jgi:hypothetical protein